METWRLLVGPFWPFVYEVSTEGRVRRRLKAWRSDGYYLGHGRYHYLRGTLESRGYRQVRLGGIHPVGRLRLVHVLVAETFLGPGPVGHEVDHIDRVRDNNRLVNLRWLRRRLNRIRHGSDHAV